MHPVSFVPTCDNYTIHVDGVGNINPIAKNSHQTHLYDSYFIIHNIIYARDTNYTCTLCN